MRCDDLCCPGPFLESCDYTFAAPLWIPNSPYNSGDVVSEFDSSGSLANWEYTEDAVSGTHWSAERESGRVSLIAAGVLEPAELPVDGTYAALYTLYDTVTGGVLCTLHYDNNLTWVSCPRVTSCGDEYVFTMTVSGIDRGDVIISVSRTTPAIYCDDCSTSYKNAINLRPGGVTLFGRGAIPCERSCSFPMQACLVARNCDVPVSCDSCFSGVYVGPLSVRGFARKYKACLWGQTVDLLFDIERSWVSDVVTSPCGDEYTVSMTLNGSGEFENTLTLERVSSSLYCTDCSGEMHNIRDWRDRATNRFVRSSLPPLHCPSECNDGSCVNSICVYPADSAPACSWCPSDTLPYVVKISATPSRNGGPCSTYWEGAFDFYYDAYAPLFPLEMQFAGEPSSGVFEDWCVFNHTLLGYTSPFWLAYRPDPPYCPDPSGSSAPCFTSGGDEFRILLRLRNGVLRLEWQTVIGTAGSNACPGYEDVILRDVDITGNECLSDPVSVPYLASGPIRLDDIIIERAT